MSYGDIDVLYYCTLNSKAQRKKYVCVSNYTQYCRLPLTVVNEAVFTFTEVVICRPFDSVPLGLLSSRATAIALDCIGLILRLRGVNVDVELGIV